MILGRKIRRSIIPWLIWIFIVFSFYFLHSLPYMKKFDELFRSVNKLCLKCLKDIFSIHSIVVSIRIRLRFLDNLFYATEISFLLSYVSITNITMHFWQILVKSCKQNITYTFRNFKTKNEWMREIWLEIKSKKNLEFDVITSTTFSSVNYFVLNNFWGLDTNAKNLSRRSFISFQSIEWINSFTFCIET